MKDGGGAQWAKGSRNRAIERERGMGRAQEELVGLLPALGRRNGGGEGRKWGLVDERWWRRAVGQGEPKQGH